MFENNYKIISFYKFIKINNKTLLKKKMEIFLEGKLVRGTVLLANEGINGSLAGKEKDIDKIIEFIKKQLKIRKIKLKINDISYLPFNKTKIRLKKEIVSLGKGKIDVERLKGKLVSPSEWDNLIGNKNIITIDVRNNFEIDIGKFKNSINPNTNSFREFPREFRKLKLNKDTEIAMYCTGGIRCEKASAYLKSNGYNKIYQLDGGIIQYLNYIRDNRVQSYWDGECFVFDDRVTINKNLEKGNYLQCYGCRHPITKNDTKLKSYEKGVSCKYCFSEKSETKIKSLRTRNVQIQKKMKLILDLKRY
tara:strand:- start:6589 stop:7506 length:918 start_codon:yes stop_codon:yes gene_type:complete